MAKKGRPRFEYTEKLGREICRAISSSSKGLEVLCKENSHWPCADTIYNWLSERADFSEIYVRAKRQQVDVLISEILQIADDSSRDTITDEHGKERYNGEWVGRSRLRIDTRKWLASKLVPRLYGDRVQVEKVDLNEDPDIILAKNIVASNRVTNDNGNTKS